MVYWTEVYQLYVIILHAQFIIAPDIHKLGSTDTLTWFTNLGTHTPILHFHLIITNMRHYEATRCAITLFKASISFINAAIMRYLFCIEAYIFFISVLQIIITKAYFYTFEDHYPYLHHFYLIMQNFPPEQKIPIWALTMMVGVVLLMGIYYKSKSIFLMQKNSYRFNFVQRNYIVIFLLLFNMLTYL